ncbi:nucleotidyltransferase domain-containing protein, partial [Candidatus Woesearchaeota archaeon]|nr:nucleotidyltransferase domain-containing protein [Candidatus Woesearchaeota archaeon]
MITKKQLKIFEAFAKNPLVELTRKQVKKESKEKSNNALAMAIQQMKKEEVLLERKIGRTGLLALNLDSEAAMDYLALCNNQRLGRELQAAIRMIKGKIDLVTPFYSLVVFGSHASGESNKSSDIDLAVFIEGDERRKRIEAAIGSAK